MTMLDRVERQLRKFARDHRGIKLMRTMQRIKLAHRDHYWVEASVLTEALIRYALETKVTKIEAIGQKEVLQAFGDFPQSEKVREVCRERNVLAHSLHLVEPKYEDLRGAAEKAVYALHIVLATLADDEVVFEPSWPKEISPRGGRITEEMWKAKMAQRREFVEARQARRAIEAKIEEEIATMTSKIHANYRSEIRRLMLKEHSLAAEAV
jgi:hypothetical protein